jgi:hypothetical protein
MLDRKHSLNSIALLKTQKSPDGETAGARVNRQPVNACSDLLLERMNNLKTRQPLSAASSQAALVRTSLGSGGPPSDRTFALPGEVAVLRIAELAFSGIRPCFNSVFRITVDF